MKSIFHGQLLNYFILYFLLAGAYQVIANFSGYLDGSLFDLSTKIWFFIALISPIVHQFYIWFCWRFELYGKLISKSFGEKGFGLYKKGFSVLIISRLVTITFLAISNQDTLELHKTMAYVIAVILAIPALYLGYSVIFFFGIDRAYGIDHFKLEEAKSMPIVKEGIFKYTKNGMYLFGFFLLYLPGFIWLSKAALLIALFNHLYIWSHFFFTEKPDMDFIYKGQQALKKDNN